MAETWGSYRARPDNQRRISDVGVHDLISSSALPEIGNPSRKFSGSLSMVVRRPLVLVSAPNFRDPDEWKRKQLSTGLMKQAREKFRKAFPHVRNCDKDGNASQADWKYLDSDLELLDIYGAKTGSRLVHLLLKGNQCDYIDDPDDPFVDQWFLISPDGASLRLGGFMELVDAGDYDGDGRSEVIFALGQPEDEDGYVLFFDDFKQKIKMSWTYH